MLLRYECSLLNDLIAFQLQSDIFFPHTLLNPPNVQDCSKGLLLLCRGEAGAMAPEVGDGEEGGRLVLLQYSL